MLSCLLKNEETVTVPKHMAVIPDGNRRFARLNKLKGVEHSKRSLENLLEWCINKNIGELSVFAWSSENWSRPQEEIDTFMDNFLVSLDEWLQKEQQNIRFIFVSSSPHRLNSDIRKKMYDLSLFTQENTKITLYIYVSYGFTEDICQADMCHDFKRQSVVPSWASNPDVLIRTSGEQRLSNFCLWHLTYTELIFVDTLFPACDETTWDMCLDIFSKRSRRHGK